MKKTHVIDPNILFVFLQISSGYYRSIKLSHNCNQLLWNVRLLPTIIPLCTYCIGVSHQQPRHLLFYGHYFTTPNSIWFYITNIYIFTIKICVFCICVMTKLIRFIAYKASQILLSKIISFWSFIILTNIYTTLRVHLYIFLPTLNHLDRNFCKIA